MGAIRKASLTSRKLAKIIAGLAADKKADNIIVLDMRAVVNFCDYFVICSGGSDRLVGAIAEYIAEELYQHGIPMSGHRGRKPSDWEVMDAGDVVTHIFRSDRREFYGLEYLWQEAKEVKWYVD